jgi:hypothetical protein
MAKGMSFLGFEISPVFTKAPLKPVKAKIRMKIVDEKSETVGIGEVEKSIKSISIKKNPAIIKKNRGISLEILRMLISLELFFTPL